MEEGFGSVIRIGSQSGLRKGKNRTGDEMQKRLVRAQVRRVVGVKGRRRTMVAMTLKVLS